MKLVQPSFTGGEISPSLYARTDLQRYGNSLKTCRNMVISAYGGCYNRPGTRFIRATKDSGTRKSRLIPFQFSTTQTYVIELGHLYARFYANGAQVVDGGGTPVQVTTPYTEDDIWGVRFTQSADVMQLVHRKYPPQTLKRLSASSFSFGEYVVYEGPFQPVNPDQAVKMAASGIAGNVTVSCNKGVFTSDMVGMLLYLENSNHSSLKPWTSGEKGVTVGTERRNAGKTYRCTQVSVGGSYVLTGGNAPQHDHGSQWDGPGDKRSDGTSDYTVGVLWQYIDSGYGIVKITGYSTATVVNALVVKPLPSGVVGGAGSPGGTWSLTGDGSTTTFSIPGNTSANPQLYAVSINGTPVVDDPNRPTYPTGPADSCVAAESFLPGGLIAAECQGHAIACVDHATLAVQHDEAVLLGLSMQPCWRIESESGAWVVISKCTKCETRERGYVYGDALEGLSLPVGGDDLAFRWERIVRVTDDGMQRVAKIYAGDRNYPAGGERGRYVSTHNMLPAK